MTEYLFARKDKADDLLINLSQAVSAFAATLLDDADANEAQGTLAYPSYLDIRFYSVTSYTFDLDDNYTYINAWNDNPLTWTVPQDSNVNFPIGSYIEFKQYRNGQLTLVGEGPVVLNTPETTKTRVRDSQIGIRKVGPDEWDVYGDLELTL